MAVVTVVVVDALVIVSVGAAVVVVVADVGAANEDVEGASEALPLAFASTLTSARRLPA